MTCKHGVELPMPDEINQLLTLERIMRDLRPARRDRALVREHRKLWLKTHPCYMCYTEL